MSPISDFLLGQNPYVVPTGPGGEPEDIRGKVYMRGNVDGAEQGAWIPKENVAEARTLGFTPSEFVLRQTSRMGGKDVVLERRLPANVYANVPAEGFAGMMTGHTATLPFVTLESTRAPFQQIGSTKYNPEIVTPQQAIGSTPFWEAFAASQRQGTSEMLPQTAALLTTLFAPEMRGIGSLLTRTGMTLAGQEAAQMGSQKIEGEQVDPRAALTRGGFGSPAASAVLGAALDLVPPLLRGSGRRLVKGGLGTAPIGAEERAWNPSMRLRVTNPLTGKVEIQSPRPTQEWTQAADAEVKLLSQRNASIAEEASKATNPVEFDPNRFTNVIEQDIAQSEQFDILSGGPTKVANEVLNRARQVLGNDQWVGGMTGGFQSKPITLERVYEISRRAGDYANRAFQARLAAAQGGNPLPEADSFELLARKIWAEAKAMMSEAGPTGKAMAANAQRQFDLIETNNLMKVAGKRSAGKFDLLTPRGSIPGGAAAYRAGLAPSVGPTLPMVMNPLYNALNPPHQLEKPSNVPIPIMGNQ